MLTYYTDGGTGSPPDYMIFNPPETTDARRVFPRADYEQCPQYWFWPSYPLYPSPLYHEQDTPPSYVDIYIRLYGFVW